MIVPERWLANTRSQKRICSYQTTDVTYISSMICENDDHDTFDAYCVFQHAIIRALRLYGEDSKEVHLMATMALIHFEKMNPTFFEQEKKSLSLTTSVDLRNYGKSLCKPFFQE